MLSRTQGDPVTQVSEWSLATEAVQVVPSHCTRARRVGWRTWLPQVPGCAPAMESSVRVCTQTQPTLPPPQECGDRKGTAGLAPHPHIVIHHLQSHAAIFFLH